MKSRVIPILIAVLFTILNGNTQRRQKFIDPMPARTAATDMEALRLMRNEKLDLILPRAMRDNNVDMWIHVTRGQDPLVMQFGQTSGYLIFTDLGEKIERAVFGSSAGAVENIDVWGSEEVARAFAGYNYNNSDPRQGFSVPEVFDEIREFVTHRDPQTIAVNYSDFLPVADGISHTQYLKLEKILGPKYSSRIVSAENVITDFLMRRTMREVAARVEVFALARQNVLETFSKVVPGVTRARDLGARVIYSSNSDMSETRSRNYILQRGDLFFCGGEPSGTYMEFEVDTKTYAYILRDGETKVPEFLQKAYDLAIAGQWIMRPYMKVGMTGGESLAAMVKAMEEAGYIYTPFADDGEKDYKMVRRVLADTLKPGFSIDCHSMGNNNMDTREVEWDIRTEGPSMAPFRPFTHQLKIQENHFFAFEYMVHMYTAEKPGQLLAFNISTPQMVTSNGVEFIQPPNERIELIR
jgi:Xaa-Pro dipeptidase